MRLSKKLLLIRRVNCQHKWSFSDGIAPRWCRFCDIKAGGRQDRKIDRIKFYLGASND